MRRRVRAAAALSTAALLLGCEAPAHDARPPPTGSARHGTDWPTYHGSPDRAGRSPDTPPVHGLSRAWGTRLDGRVYAGVLVAGGRLLAATENNTMYSLDPRTGRIQWQRHVATPVPLSALPCGNIDPLGITGTPVYDPATHRVYAVAESRAGARVRHELVGFDARSGRLVLRRPADPPDQDPAPMQQRAALLLHAGVVYVAYGGLDGDCGNYHGHVVGVPVDRKPPLALYRVPVGREGGIWAASGPALRSDGSLLVAVGNGDSTSAYDGSDSVLALSVPALRRTSFFAPRQWADDNAGDADLGSMGPAPLADGRVVAAGKNGEIYLLAGGDLGGIGGEVARINGCRAFGGAAVAGSAVYLPCTSGLRQIRVGPGNRLSTGWHAGQATGSPVVGGGAVLALDTDNGDLYAFDARSGRVRARRHVGAVTRFATPTLWADYVFVGTARGVVASRVS